MKTETEIETRNKKKNNPCSIKRYIKNSSVEWESGSHVRPGRSSIEISITRKPRYVGSMTCKPLGL